MDGFNLGALIVSFIALLFLANLGHNILNNWETPASHGEPITTAGGVHTDIVAKPVTMPGTGQPIAVMPVPGTPSSIATDAPVPMPVVVPLASGSPATTPVRTN